MKKEQVDNLAKQIFISQTAKQVTHLVEEYKNGHLTASGLVHYIKEELERMGY